MAKTTCPLQAGKLGVPRPCTYCSPVSLRNSHALGCNQFCLLSQPFLYMLPFLRPLHLGQLVLICWYLSRTSFSFPDTDRHRFWLWVTTVLTFLLLIQLTEFDWQYLFCMFFTRFCILEWQSQDLLALSHVWYLHKY